MQQEQALPENEREQSAQYESYSVLLSVWAHEKPAYFTESLKSVFSQTVLPAEVVIVKDGELTPELDEVIAVFEKAHPGVIKPVALPVNVGLGAALREGLEHCTCELIARMDSDDLCVPERMEKQLRYFAEHPDIDILSGAIDEFDSSPAYITGSRLVPLENEDIWRFARTRSPFNHAAVMYRKSAVLRAGSYRGDLTRVEDHDLWMRMYRTGAKAANLPDHILLVRCGREMHTRRHGLKNARALRRFYRDMYLWGEIGYFHYLLNVFCACGLQLMPGWLHRLCYALLRSQKKPYSAPKRAAEPVRPLPRGDRLLRRLSDEERRELQAEMLDIYRDVKRVCDARGLRLLLAGGSCLGAVRHGGFVPWDDDMDAVMPRVDYERLKRVFDAELGEKYELFCPSCPGHAASNLFMKISRKGSAGYTQVMQAGAPGGGGVWLDIVPMEYAPDSRFRRFVKGLACDALAYGAVSRYLYAHQNRLTRAYMSDTLRHRFAYALRRILGFLLSFKSCEDWYALFDRFSQETEASSTVTFPAGIRHYLGEAIALDAILPASEGVFEGETVALPAKAHTYLKQLYGSDYLIPLPPQARQGHQFLKPEYEEMLR